MMYLMSVRQKHKKTFAIIDELYDLSFSAKSTESFKDFQTDIIDQQHCEYNFLHLTFKFKISRKYLKLINIFYEIN
uniref:Uncharacterized protein n=1 Tax=Onchocerca volvulus TaxID=6282 RepID=A0A8R1XNN3_ONCVO